MAEYVNRIDDSILNPDYKDGEVLQHTDVNELIEVFKKSINANYEDIQKIQDGSVLSGNASKLDNASLLKTTDGELDASDMSVPSSGSVLKALEGVKPKKGVDYWTEQEIDKIVTEATDAILGEANNKIDQNYAEKTEAFNDNAAQKQIDFDNYFEAKKAEFAEYVEQLKQELNG